MQSESELNAPIHRPYLRVLFGVFFILVCFLSFLWWALNSPAFARYIFEHLINSSAAQSARLSAGNFSGDIASGIHIDTLKMQIRRPQLSLELEEVYIDFSVSDFVKTGRLLASATVSVVTVSASGIPEWVDELPLYHSFSCAVSFPAGIRLDSLKVSQIKTVVDSQLIICVDNFSLQERIKKSTNQPLSFEINARYKDRLLGSGEFDGKMFSRGVEGKIKLEMFKQTLASEIAIVRNRGNIDLSGFISNFQLNLTDLSRWLSPLWQDEFPFGLDGVISFSGSWLFNKNTGFLGNFSGKCEKVRMVAMGLFIPIFEINTDWRMYDNNLEFNDTGSYFVYYPAKLVGGVESVLSSSPKYDLAFSSDSIDFSSFADNLPWGVRYTISLPRLKGAGELKVEVSDTLPKVSARLMTKDLAVGKGLQLRNIAGEINYNRIKNDSGLWKLEFSMASNNSLPPLFHRFTNLPRALGKVNEVTYSYKAEGISLSDFSKQGVLTTGENNQTEVEGQWTEGMGFLRAMPKDSSLQRVFVAHDVEVLDLILGN